MNDDGRIYLGELCQIINRRPNTVRHWERSGRLPRRLRPARSGAQGWRSWSREQVLGIQKWMADESMIPGAGLTHFDPTPEKVDRLLANLRGRRAA